MAVTESDFVEAFNLNKKLLKEFSEMQGFMEDLEKFINLMEEDMQEVVIDYKEAMQIFISATEDGTIYQEKLNKSQLKNLLNDEEDARETVIELIELINSMEEESEQAKESLENMEGYMERLENDLSTSL